MLVEILGLNRCPPNSRVRKRFARLMAQNETPVADINLFRIADPKLAEKLKDLVQEQERGITYHDRQILALGVESGARADYIQSQLGQFKTELERQAFLHNLRKKKILTPDVEAQLRRLTLERKAAAR